MTMQKSRPHICTSQFRSQFTDYIYIQKYFTRQMYIPLETSFILYDYDTYVGHGYCSRVVRLGKFHATTRKVMLIFVDSIEKENK